MLMGDCSTFQSQWVLGKVTATHPGQDGLVRAAEVAVPQAVRPLPAGTLGMDSFAKKIKVKTTIYRRPVVKLARLFIEEDEKFPGQDKTPVHSPQDVQSPMAEQLATN